MILRVTLFLLLSSWCIPASGQTDASLDGPKNWDPRLLGKWEMKTRDLTFVLNIDGKYIQMSAATPVGSKAFAGAGIAKIEGIVKNDEGQFIMLTLRSSPGVPNRIQYRFEGKTLVATIGEGSQNRVYRLRRAPVLRRLDHSWQRTNDSRIVHRVLGSKTEKFN